MKKGRTKDFLRKVSSSGILRRVGGKSCHMLARWFAEPISSTLKMEAICSSETSVETQRTTRRHILEDDTLHNHHCENLKSYKGLLIRMESGTARAAAWNTFRILCVK
jgi:hypothetical protein